MLMGNAHTGKVIVMGVGNELLKDEGVGVHVARELAERQFTFPVEILEAGTVPDCWMGDESIEKLVVIDAVYGGGAPGAIYRFSPEEVEFESDLMTSVHQLGIGANLRLSELTGTRPKEIVIIGVEPKVVEWGLELSQELQSRVSDVVNAVLKEITPFRAVDQDEGPTCL